MCTKKEKVEKLVGNAKLSAEQLELLMGMDEEQLAMMQAIAGGMAAVSTPAEPEAQEDKPDVESMVANALDKLTKAPIIERIKANESNALSDATLKAMNADELNKYEQSIRPVDYSGAGGTHVVVNSGTKKVTPFPAMGLAATKQERK